jgi:hypothetical protein
MPLLILFWNGAILGTAECENSILAVAPTSSTSKIAVSALRLLALGVAEFLAGATVAQFACSFFLDAFYLLRVDLRPTTQSARLCGRTNREDSV